MKVGLEVFASSGGALDSTWGRVGLLSNQASVDRHYTPAWEIMHRHFGGRLTCLFGPQHGFFGTVQDNMIETDHDRHGPTGLPLFSLYSEIREPTESMLANLDTLVIDLQITGCRIYTWKSTIMGCLRAAKKYGKRVVILDRPNPIGGVDIEGMTLEKAAYSFVGQMVMPMRHGLTAGEAAKLANLEVGAELEIVPLKDWDPASFWYQLERPYVLTSPNLPVIEPVYLYPGTVIFEGTNLSEGRGTALPFNFLGAPYIPSPEAYVERVKELVAPYREIDQCGVYLRPCQFQPTYQKWAGKICNGLQFHVTKPKQVPSCALALAGLRAAMELAPDHFEFIPPPYEYNFDITPIKLILGRMDVVERLKSLSFDLTDSYWHDGCEAYINRVKPILLYPRVMSVLR